MIYFVVCSSKYLEEDRENLRVCNFYVYIVYIEHMAEWNIQQYPLLAKMSFDDVQ